MVLGVAAVAFAQNSPRAGMLEQDGFAAIRAGRAQEAADAFKAAIALDVKNPRLHFGAGLAAFLQRRDADAKSALEQALALDPRFTVARAQLAQVLRRQQDFQGAINLYETIVVERPDDAAARDTLARWKRERDLHDRMRLAVGDHFTVSFEGPEDAEMASKALESLDRAFWRISDVLGAFPAKSIPVVLYSGEQFRDITRSPSWAAGAYDGTIRVPMRGALARSEELDRVLAHEFAHALIRTLSARTIPTWLNEGLAAALEGDDLGWAQRIAAQVRVAPSLTQLAAPFARLSGGDAQVAYAASALAARRLLDEAGGAAVANLLRDLGDGLDFEAAFLHRIQRSFADFQASLGV
jgi:tetratricopeptide (TPR) repeat protein